MKIQRVPTEQRLHCSWLNEWRELFPRGDWNWRTFHVVQVEIEDDRMMGNWELTVVLLGLGFRLVWVGEDTEARKRIRDDLDRFLGEEPTE